MTRIIAVEVVRYLPSSDRTTWRVQLACGLTYDADRWGKDRPVIGEEVACRCVTCARADIEAGV